MVGAVTHGPLHGIRVLDMTRVIAGPYAAQILGDLGADVVKIERREEGDDIRQVGPPWMPAAEGATRTSTYYSSVNRNKRSVTVDFTVPEGAALVGEMARTADVLLENYRTGTLAKYGLDYESLRKTNPRLVYGSLTGFGQSGPYAERAGYDYVAQAMSGLMALTGPADGQPGAGPTRVGAPVADTTAGLYMTIGVLSALFHREKTGVGQLVDIGLFDAQMAILLNAFSAWFNAGRALERTGNDHPSAAPYGVYEVDDGDLLIATFNDREFGRLAAAVGHPEWHHDPRYAKNAARVANRAQLKADLREALRGKTRSEWTALLVAANVSCGPIHDMADVEKDPHVLARQMVVRQEHPLSGPIHTIASPLRLSASPVEYRRAPPELGQDTDEVLHAWLELDDDKIAALRARNVI
jgi:crotonobetainyl-CoA:carnitine CoA-transferase CaiB-like acyl-CoA transferase